MRTYKPYLIWVLIIAGLLWGYQGVTSQSLLTPLLGVQITGYVEITVGVIAAVVAYLKLTGKDKKSK